MDADKTLYKSIYKKNKERELKKIKVFNTILKKCEKKIKLYDIKNDIGESTNLSKIYKNGILSNRLEKLLDKYLKKVKAPKWQPGITWKENPLKIINSFH